MPEQEPTLRELLQLFVERNPYNQRRAELFTQVTNLQERVDAMERATAEKRAEWVNARQLAAAAMTVAFASLSLSVTVLLLLVNHLIHT